MRKVKVKLVTLGNLKFAINFNAIERWKTAVFEAEHIDQIQALPNAEGPDWEYTDDQLTRLLQTDNGFDFTLGIMNSPLQNGFYMRRLSNNICVLSLSETGPILQRANLEIEKFILRNIYQLTSLYLESNRRIPDSSYSLSHDETRSCLFDMNANIEDIIFSTSNPIICHQCRARIMQSQVCKEFLPATEKELKKIKQALYFRIVEFVKKHPVWSLIFTTLGALVIDVSGNYVYDIIKDILPH